MLLIILSFLSIISLAIVYLSLKTFYLWYIPLLIGFFFGYFIIWAIFIVIITLCHKKDSKIDKPNWIYYINIKMACEVLKIFYNVKIVYEGLDLLKNKKSFLLVLNHQSYLDPIITMDVLSKWRFAFIMKKEIRNIFLVGRFLEAAGYFYLDRDDDRKALKTILDSVNRIKNGYPVGVFPEGTRSKGKNLGEMHSGTFKIAQKAKSDIAVMILDNTYKVKDRFPFKRTKVLIKICDVLLYDDIKVLTTQEIKDKVTSIMSNSLKESREKYSFLN